jgi:hypothetical protein
VIDRVARQHLALLLRRLVTGRITTDDFENDRPDASRDSGVTAISLAAWTSLYSDFWPVRLTARRKLSDDTRSHVVRWILFLKSDNPYEWSQPPSFWQRLSSILIRRPTRSWNAWKAQGDFEVWPFFRRADYNAALSSPPFLNGSSETE